MTVDALRIAGRDGVHLEAEVHRVDGTRAAAVLFHPHPQYGGSMRALLIGDLFRALPAAGVTALRFNFRGVERSDGGWDGGRGERDDAAAATEALAATTSPAVPLVAVGWSFGADMALSVLDPRLAGWCAIAPPLRYVADLDAVGRDPRPKHVVLGEHDDVVPADRVADVTAAWTRTTTTVVAGASHFFVGRTAEVTAAVLRFVIGQIGPAAAPA